MLFHKLDPTSEIPIYEQIENQIIFAVAAGTLRPGEMILSVRELAKVAGVHPNTVARAYQVLESKNVLVARRGCGMEVTADAPAWCKQSRQETIRLRLRSCLREAVTGGLSSADIRRLVEEELIHVNGQSH
jgi:GntR family transcriptional regulator